MIDKQVKTTADAVTGVRDGSTVLVAGFGAVGVADNLLDALHDQGARELTIVANNSGNGDYGLARLISSGRVRKSGPWMLNSSDIEMTFFAVSYSFSVGSETSRISAPSAL